MKTVLLFILISVFSMKSRAAEFLDGYIVLTNNDTLSCKFKIGGFISATNFFNKLTIITEQGEEKVYHASEKKVLAYGFVEKGRKYEYLYVDVKPKSENGFYQRIVNGAKYKLYVHVTATQTNGVTTAQPTYVLFNNSGDFIKFENCVLCPWKKSLREFLKDDAKSLEAVESASRVQIPKFINEINML